MKTRVKCVLAIVVVLSIAACATVSKDYPDGDADGESVTLVMTQPVPQITVIVNDQIVVDARFAGTRKVEIQEVPPGVHEVQVVANSWQLKEPLDHLASVEVRDHGVTETVRVPPYSGWYWAYLIASAAVSVPVGYYLGMQLARLIY